MRGRLVNDRVGVLARLDLGLDGQRLDVENGDIIVAAIAGEPEPEIVGNRDPMHAGGAHNRADQLIGVGIDHLRLRAVRDIQAVVGVVHVRIVPAVPAADFDFRDDFVCRRRGEGSGCGDDEKKGRFHGVQLLCRCSV